MSSFPRGSTIPFLLAAISSLSSSASQTPPAEKYRLRGQVVDKLTNRPISDVELILETANQDPFAGPVAPDSEGRFVFADLPAGKYILSATRPDFGTIHFGEMPDPHIATAISVGPGKDAEVIAFRLVPRGAVSGIVRDEFGDPLPRAHVTLSHPVWSDGNVIQQPAGFAYADDRGRYRIGNVRPGPYVVCASASQGRNAVAPSAGPIDFLTRGSPRHYTRACSKPLSIAPAEAASANLTVTSTSAVRIRGRLVNSVAGMPVGLMLIPSDPLGPRERIGPSTFDSAKGTFEFHGIPPGKYRLEANLAGRTPEGEIVSKGVRLPIVVGNEDLENVELTLQPTGEITVVLQGLEENTLSRGAVQLGLRLTTQDPDGPRWTYPDGNPPRFSGLYPGVYWLVTRSTANACIQSAKLGGQEVLHGTVTVTPAMAGSLDVIASKSCGVVNGRVIASQQPVRKAKVLLLRSGSAENPGDMVTGFADEQGEFSFPGLPFGRYQLWAWSVDDASAFVGPVSLAEEAKRAVAVDVGSEEPVQVELTLLQAEGQVK